MLKINYSHGKKESVNIYLNNLIIIKTFYNFFQTKLIV